MDKGKKEPDKKTESKQSSQQPKNTNVQPKKEEKCKQPEQRKAGGG